MLLAHRGGVLAVVDGDETYTFSAVELGVPVNTKDAGVVGAPASGSEARPQEEITTGGTQCKA